MTKAVLSAMVASHEMPKISSKLPEAKNRNGRTVPYKLQREHGPADILISDF